MSYSLAGNAGLGSPFKVRQGFDTSGPWTEYVYHGTQSAVYGAIAEGLGNFSSYSVENDGPVWMLNVRYAATSGDPGDPEIPVREERLHWNRPTKSIYSSPRWDLNVDDYQKQAIRKEFIAGKELNDILKLTFKGAGDIEYSLNPDGKLLAAFIAADVTSFIVYQPVVIITDTASKAYPWTPNFGNYGFAWTTALLQAQLTSGWKNNLPASGPSDKAGFFFGWLKGPPEITTSGNSRSQLVQEWEFGIWPTELYGTVA